MENNSDNKKALYVIATIYDGITYYYNKKGGFKWNIWGNGIATYKTLKGVTRKAEKLAHNSLYMVSIGDIIILHGVEGQTLAEYKTVETLKRN